MRVLVVHIGIVRMEMCQRHVCMFVGVGLGTIPREVMGVLVVNVMHVCMGMRDRRVCVPMRVVLGQVQPDAGAHQHRSRPETR